VGRDAGTEPVLSPAIRLSTCGNCPACEDHPDLRGQEPDPARRDGPPAPQV